jgi:uncharacterized membrane protein YfcA
VTAVEVAVIAAAGFVAGVVNTMAGGGSLLTVPLLVMMGMPGTIANGTNRVAVFVQSAVGALRFRAEGVSGFSKSLPVLVPMVLGGTLGAYGVAHLDDATFERLFGVLMLLLLVPALRQPRNAALEPEGPNIIPTSPLGPTASAITFFAIGLYGGSFQAGVGIFLVLALARAGHGLVVANSIKTVAVAAFTAVAAAIFIFEGQVVWLPALLLSAATAVGAAVGVRVAVRGGDRVIRPVIALAVIAMAGRMLRLY